MSKSPKSKGPGPKPSGKLLHGGASNKLGRQAQSSFPANVVPTAPGLSGNPDVVHERTAQAMQGVMEKNQLKKNKSAGLKSF